MAGKITDAPNYTNPDPANDVIEIVNVSGNTNGKITRNNYLGITSTPVGINDNQTLTSKTLTSPTINSGVLGGTFTGTYTFAGTPTFPASVVTLTGSQTLTNKILTSPTITSPTITNASITSDAITGFSNANNGSIFGLTVTGGTLGTGALATNAVQGNQLATSAITLGYTQITSNFTTTSATPVQVTGLTTTVTIPSGGRRIKITVYIWAFTQTVASGIQLSLWDGVVASGTQLSKTDVSGSATQDQGAVCMAIVTPAAGSKTYNASMQTGSGTSTANASSVGPAFILVEAI